MFYKYNLQTGDPTGSGDGGESIWGVLEGPNKRFFKAEYQPKIRHSEPGLLSMVSLGDNLIASQFFLTLGSDLSSLDGQHCVIGQVTEGMDILRHLNDAICDHTHRPYQDIRITHTVVLDDPFENPRGFRAPSRSPSPSAERLQGGRIGADEDIDDTAGKTEQEIHEMLQEREAKARATILEIVGDLPDADVAPPENVLFVCKLNPVTSDDDLEIIFSRFGKVKGCEVIRDRTTGDSLQYAFVEFEDSKACENAYFKMDNVLIDDRRIHVDFSQSVAKVQWKGKGRGLIFKDGNKTNRLNFNDLKGKNNSNNGQKSVQNYRERERQPNRRGDYKDSRDRRYSRSPNSNKTDSKRGYQRGPYQQNNRQSSRSKSRDRNRKRSRSRSRDHRRRSVSRSRSRSRNVNKRRPVSRSRSRSRSRGDRNNRIVSRYDRNIDRRQSPSSQRHGSDRFKSSDIARHSRKSSPSPRRKSPAKDQRKSKKSKRSKSSDSDSSAGARKKSKKSKNKRKKKKSKKSKRASSTESSSSDSSSSD